MRFFYLIVLFSLLPFALQSQQLIPAASSDEPGSRYLQQARQYALVFNGREHEKYPIHFENHPWLVNPEFTRGTLVYRGIVYPNLAMKVDLYRNELVISSDDAPFSIVADPALVDSVRLHNLQLVYRQPIEGELPGGYYVLIHQGKTRLLMNYELSLRDLVEDGRLVTRFETQKNFWLLSGSETFRIKKYYDLTNHFDTSRNQLRAFINSNQLNFRRNPEQTLTLLLQHLDPQ